MIVEIIGGVSVVVILLCGIFFVSLVPIVICIACCKKRQRVPDIQLQFTYKCDICDYTTTESSDALILHKIDKHDIYPYKCDTCNKGFPNLHMYGIHACNISLSLHKQKEVEIFSENSIEEVVIEKKENPITIENIPKLIDSENVSDDILVFKCDKCDFTTDKTKKTLINHKMKIHNVFPYNCNICYQGFSNKKVLKSHECVPPKFKCDKCSYICNLKKELQIHDVLEHPTFVCDLCEFKTNKTVKALINHKATAHNIFPYMCELCDSGFTNKKKYKSHIKNDHLK